ncbi:MAG: endolytic transglycosylase MltG [Candidatus Gracilibacteria bacterium]|nr:endolytic transglycosylase MltG [Candidatus Gracilibacteria bacterium]
MGTEFRKKNVNMTSEISTEEAIKKPSSFFRIVKLFFWIIILVFIYIYYSYSSFQSKIIVNNDLILEVKAGDTFKNLGKKIDELNNMYYNYYIKNHKPDFELQVGSYKINAGSNIEQTIESLKTPITSEIKLTILEGWNIYDIDEYLNKKGLINAGEYIDYVTNKEKITALSSFFSFIDNQITLEGFLYPDTYNVDSVNFKINSFVIKQLETFETKVYNKILSELDNQTITDLINLASIVEKEERNNDEKPTVAGILKKRLNSNWMIGADITVCYPHKLTSEQCKMVISKYINEKSEYNTRTMFGLPKTPIGNPSYETINATLNDKKTSYWFYLHDTKTGKIYYAETNEEHENNKKYMY